MPSAQPEGLLSNVGKDAASVLAASIDRLTGVLAEALDAPRRIEFSNLKVTVGDRPFILDGVVTIGPPKS